MKTNRNIEKLIADNIGNVMKKNTEGATRGPTTLIPLEMIKEAFKEMNTERASNQNIEALVEENIEVTLEVSIEDEENIEVETKEAVTEGIISKVQGGNTEAVIVESLNKKIGKNQLEIRSKSMMMIMSITTKRSKGFNKKEFINITKLIIMMMLTNHTKKSILLNIMMITKKRFMNKINQKYNKE